MLPTTPSIILASGSPRRRELLRSMGLSFEVAPSDVDEERSPMAGEEPAAFAERLAALKASVVAPMHPQAAVLGADTIVVLGGRVLGKPTDAQEAERMLRDLRGLQHQVITGVTVVPARGRPLTAHAVTTVRFRSYSDDEIRSYIASGQPMDKAGAYGIQDDLLHAAEAVEGCLFNVIGLPCCLVTELFARAGVIVVPASDFAVPEACRHKKCGLL